MANLILGTSGADTLLGGTAGPDAILGFDQNVTAAAGQLATLEASRVASGLSSPVFVTAPPLDPDHLFIVERAGRVVVLDLASGAIAPEPFLDLSGQVATTGEEGLLGLAFDPGFADNRRFYVYLSNPAGDSEVREYLALSGNSALRADPDSARLVLRVDQPPDFSNHKAGWIGFDPDGQLHVALGDGGGGGDPFGNGQNLATPLGAILRLDPGRDDFPADPERNYGIPADNPFAAAGTGAAPEIWAYGLRNPWRDSFDRATGELWIGDVGQDRWEEINLGVAGANFGWNRFEGPDPYTPGATPEGLTAPLFAYGHDLGSAVTGGYVYRGPEEVLQGAYLFADSGSGRVWALEHGAAASGVPPVVTELTGKLVPDAGALSSPVSFGEDAEGRLYVVDLDGEVFRLTPRGLPGVPADGADLLDGGAGDDRLFAGAGADRLLGAEGADTLFGMAGADRLEGGPDADRLWGGEGDDWLSGGPGADWIHGGPGTDTAAFSGLRGDYAVSAEGSVLTIADRRPAEDGTDRVSAVELFAFADGVMTLDTLLRPEPVATQAVYRFYNLSAGGHLYTTDAAERDMAMSAPTIMRYEGVGFSVPLDPSAPGVALVHRFYEPISGDHHYTISGEEAFALLNTPGWQDEGNVFLASITGGAGLEAVHRFFDAGSRTHFFTADPAERDGILAHAPAWTYEGIAFYVPAQNAATIA
ncbi:hypothetical protein E0493_21235 [Roseomonas sp. M0104]|uniref:Glucose/Sorbosone dehydrogenase domain-containing protein n=1 Tax=Teichococcus coralli TaxID=2545983 RepID=A0A845BKT3_9PROT|nr:PQQ-dependent sugar dehydrogenase [Pseudoroseomonas coralli]MXP65877.1 hypothetical protein [Pseudoroseomonas coralli]